MIAAHILWRKAHRFVIARPQRGRGNLVQAAAISPMAFQRSNKVLRDSHVASLHGMPNLKVLRSGSPLQYLQLPQALTARKGHAASVRRQSRQRLRSERRYRHNRSVRFFGSRYGTAVPSRDCHVGLRPPRNDKPVSLALSAFHFQLSIFHSRLPLPCNFPHKGPQTVKKPVQPKISEGRKV